MTRATYLLMGGTSSEFTELRVAFGTSAYTAWQAASVSKEIKRPTNPVSLDTIKIRPNL